jgi:hypothetical protein
VSDVKAMLENVLVGSVEGLEAGRQELVALGDDLDPMLNKYLDIITDWALEAKEKYNLSDPAVTFLLYTAPDALTAYVAGLTRKETER